MDDNPIFRTLAVRGAEVRPTEPAVNCNVLDPAIVMSVVADPGERILEVPTSKFRLESEANNKVSVAPGKLKFIPPEELANARAYPLLVRFTAPKDPILIAPEPDVLPKVTVPVDIN